MLYKLHSRSYLIFPVHHILIEIVVYVRVGKEFPDTRQSERRMKLIRVGDAVRTLSWLKKDPNTFLG